MNDALTRRAPRVERDAELFGVLPQGLHLPSTDLVRDRAVGGRHVVVHGRDRQAGSTDRAAGQSQPVEGLRAGHLMNQVQVHVEKVGLAVGSVDDVLLPDLLGERLLLADEFLH